MRWAQVQFHGTWRNFADTGRKSETLSRDPKRLDLISNQLSLLYLWLEGITPLDGEAGEYGENLAYPDSRLRETKIILGR